MEETNRIEPIVVITKLTDFDVARRLARLTVGKEDIDKPVSDKFKTNLIASEHSPLRAVSYLVEITNIPVVISQQFTRHAINLGGTFVNEHVNPTDVTHCQTSQRPDWTGVERSEYTNLSFISNAQGIIDMSKKRLCMQASKGARDIWTMVANKINTLDPILANKMQPSCIHIGGCPEALSKCKYYTTEAFHFKRAVYISEFLKVD